MVKTSSEQLNSLQEFEYKNTAVLAGIFRTGEMIALKPVCENLGISWSWQFEQLKNDSLLNQLFGKQKVVSKDGKSYEMVCLPPTAFQEWLWNIKSTEKTNSELLEEYKRGLVVHIMTMLAISLNEIDRLRVVESNYNRLKVEVQQLIMIDDEGKQFTRQAKEKFKYAKNLKDVIMKRLTEGEAQLTIEM
jgi:hypothetical protein